MNIITSNKSQSGIGFDIGNGITNFIIKHNSILPLKNTVKFIIKEENKNIKLYEGINNLSKNNLYLFDLKVNINTLYFIEISAINNNYYFINLNDKVKNIFKKCYKFKNFTFFVDEHNINLNNIKLIYLFKCTKEKIIKKLSENELFPKEQLDKITIKLNENDNNLHKMENQQIMDKIILLKNNFLID